MTRQDLRSANVDATSVEAAYRLHLPAIVRYLRRRLGDDVAEDAAAEVFARAVRAHNAGQVVSLPWLFGVAANVIYERRRNGDGFAPSNASPPRPALSTSRTTSTRCSIPS